MDAQPGKNWYSDLSDCMVNSAVRAILTLNTFLWIIHIYQFCAFFVVVSLKCASVPHPFWKGRFIIVHTYGRYKLYTSTEFFVVLFCFLNCFLSSLSFFLHYTRQHMHARTSHFFTQQIRTLYLEISRVYFCLIGCLFLSLEKPLGSDSKPALSSRLE